MCPHEKSEVGRAAAKSFRCKEQREQCDDTYDTDQKSRTEGAQAEEFKKNKHFYICWTDV